MTKKGRTIIFSVFVLMFFLTTPVVIFYFQGYRFDFETKKVVQTGAFYFKASPNSAEVYLNGDLKKKTSGFTGSVLIENLMPKEYRVEIKKGAFYSWQKTLEVRESQVTEARHIILFPKNPNFSIVSEKPETEMTATSSDKKKVVDFNNYEIWVSFLDAPEEEKVFITRFSEKIGKVFWLTDYYLVFNVGDKIKIAEIDDRDKVNIIELADIKNFAPYRNEISSAGPEIFWDEKSRKLYVLSNGNLYQSELLFP